MGFIIKHDIILLILFVKICQIQFLQLDWLGAERIVLYMDESEQIYPENLLI